MGYITTTTTVFLKEKKLPGRKIFEISYQSCFPFLCSTSRWNTSVSSSWFSFNSSCFKVFPNATTTSLHICTSAWVAEPGSHLFLKFKDAKLWDSTSIITITVERGKEREGVVICMAQVSKTHIIFILGFVLFGFLFLFFFIRFSIRVDKNSYLVYLNLFLEKQQKKNVMITIHSKSASRQFLL